MTTIYRQGDVMLVKVDGLPHDMIFREPDLSAEFRLVLAYGEATGHAHAIYPEVIAEDEIRPIDHHLPVKAWEAGAERYIQVLEKTALKHEEHAPIPLDPGIYKVVRQREYDPQQARLMAD